MSQSQKPTHDVLVASNLNKRHPDDNDHLRRIGAAWQHKDGKGFTLQLFALPLDGRLVLREPLPDDDAGRRDDDRSRHDQRSR